MTTQECIITRRSIRQFRDTPVGHDIIREIVADAAYAPSWKNSQTTRYIVVEGKLKDEIAEKATALHSNNGTIIKNASALVVVASVDKISGYERDGSYTTSKGDRWTTYDAGIASQTFCLAAHDRGIGSVILGIFDEKAVAELINLDEGCFVSALIPIGYPAATPNAPLRKDVDELLIFK